VIARLGRVVVVLFALLGFVCVPLGKKTGLEHVVAILKTGAAADTGHALVESAARLRRRVLAALGHARPRAVGSANLIAVPARRAACDAGAPDASAP
jgi:hypothetical protein